MKRNVFCRCMSSFNESAKSAMLIQKRGRLDKVWLAKVKR